MCKLCKCVYKLFGGYDNWRENWCRWAIFFGLSLLILILALFDLVGEMKICNQNIHYLLSSISQGLATVFALVVTMPMLITALLARNKDNNKRRVLYSLVEMSPHQVALYVFYVITIVLPLWLLYTNCMCPLLIRLSFASAIICLVAVIGAAYSFKKRVLKML
jgi:hypothetical protein